MGNGQLGRFLRARAGWAIAGALVLMAGAFATGCGPPPPPPPVFDCTLHVGEALANQEAKVVLRVTTSPATADRTATFTRKQYNGAAFSYSTVATRTTGANGSTPIVTTSWNRSVTFPPAYTATVDGASGPCNVVGDEPVCGLEPPYPGFPPPVRIGVAFDLNVESNQYAAPVTVEVKTPGGTLAPLSGTTDQYSGSKKFGVTISGAPGTVQMTATVGAATCTGSFTIGT